MRKFSDKTLGLVQLALMSAIILMLAFTPYLGYIPLGFMNATIIHVPVIIGSILLGPKKGAFLGFLFGVTSLLNNTFIHPNITSFVFSPFYSANGESGNFLSLIICFVPRILIGIVPYYVYKLICKLDKKENNSFSSHAVSTAGLAIAGLAGSLTNTVPVMTMIYLFFGESYAAATGRDFSALFGAIMTIVGVNGVPEAIVAAILTCAVCKAIFLSGTLRKKKGKSSL